MRFVTWLLTTAAAVTVAAWLLDGIWFDGPASGTEEFTQKVIPVLIVSFILGMVTVFVEPVVKFFSIPFIIITIGLFLLVINALMLMLTGWIAEKVGVGFYVEGFWAALLGGIIITLVNGFINIAVLDDDK
jgi:putative membrane protein